MNSQSSFVEAGSSKSYSGCATGRTRLRAAAFQNQPLMWLSTASVISPLAADALQQHLARHPPLAEARHLDALREIVAQRARRRGARRATEPEPSAGLRFSGSLDLGLHAVHSSRERPAEVERSRHVSAWNLSLLGLAGAIWLTIFTAMAYAVRVRAQLPAASARREDSNLKGLAAQRDLNPPRLPVPPRPRSKIPESRLGARNEARGRLCAHERRATRACRPDGRRVAYVVSHTDEEANDLRDRDLGGAARRLRRSRGRFTSGERNDGVSALVAGRRLARLRLWNRDGEDEKKAKGRSTSCRPTAAGAAAS